MYYYYFYPKALNLFADAITSFTHALAITRTDS